MGKWAWESGAIFFLKDEEAADDRSFFPLRFADPPIPVPFVPILVENGWETQPYGKGVMEGQL